MEGYEDRISDHEVLDCVDHVDITDDTPIVTGDPAVNDPSDLEVDGGLPLNRLLVDMGMAVPFNVSPSTVVQWSRGVYTQLHVTPTAVGHYTPLDREREGQRVGGL